jgi:nitrite reductase (NADH) small subunit
MWIKAGKASELDEGKSQIVNANNKELALFKIEGKVYALENTCPHRGGPLVEGYLEGSEVTCPWHAWVFDVKTGVCQTMPDTKQPTFKVKIESGEILVEV